MASAPVLLWRGAPIVTARYVGRKQAVSRSVSCCSRDTTVRARLIRIPPTEQLRGGRVLQPRRNIFGGSNALKDDSSRYISSFVYSSSPHDEDSSSSHGSGTGTDSNIGAGKILYERDPSRLRFPRYLVGFSSLHALYWTWYVVDFQPAVAKAGTFEVNETVGIFGLGLSLAMLAGSCLYPRFLIGEIRKLPKGSRTLVKCYTLPLVRLEAEGTSYPRGTLRIDGQADRQRLLSRGGGSISNYDGHLGIKAGDSRFHLLLQPQPGEVCREAELAGILLEADGSANDGGMDAKAVEKHMRNETRGGDDKRSTSVRNQRRKRKEQRERRRLRR